MLALLVCFIICGIRLLTVCYAYLLLRRFPLRDIVSAL